MNFIIRANINLTNTRQFKFII